MEEINFNKIFLTVGSWGKREALYSQGLRKVVKHKSLGSLKNTAGMFANSTDTCSGAQNFNFSPIREYLKSSFEVILIW